MNLDSALDNALRPAAIIRDGARLSLLALISYLSLLIDYPRSVTLLLIGANVAGLLLVSVALFVTVRAVREGRSLAGKALAGYLALLLALLLALTTLVVG